METTLSEWASIAEIVSAIVVTLSLIFVGMQIRSNTVATQAATLQDSVGYDAQILTTVGATAEASLALYDFSFRQDGLTEERLVQGRWLFASMEYARVVRGSAQQGRG